MEILIYKYFFEQKTFMIEWRFIIIYVDFWCQICNDVVMWPDHLTRHTISSEQFYKIISFQLTCHYPQTYYPRSIPNLQPIRNVTSLALRIQTEVLYVCEPKGLDYLLTNLFPSSGYKGNYLERRMTSYYWLAEPWAVRHGERASCIQLDQTLGGQYQAFS